MRIRLTISAVLLFGSILSFGQLLPEQIEAGKKEYPNSKGYLKNLSYDFELVYDKKQQKLRAFQTKNETRVFLSNQANAFSEDKVFFSINRPILEIEAFALNYDGDKVVKNKVKEFDTTNSFSNSIFFDDSKYLEFIFDGLKRGSEYQVRTKHEIKELHFFGSASIGGYFPVKDGKITLTFPNTVKINFQESNFEGFNIKRSELVGKKTTTFTWVFTEIPRFKYINENVKYDYVMPDVTFQISSYEDPELGHVDFLPDTNALYKWYYSLITKPQEAEDEGLKQKVTELTAGVSSDKEKARIIYHWVQNNIDYIALEYGKGGIVPREGKLTYERRYGDCKDMSCLMKKMLSYADVEAHMAWIGTDDIPLTYRDAPTPLVDNHMICVYIENDSVYYLDATDAFNPFGNPTGFIQEQQTMIELGPDNYVINKVPAVSMENNGISDSCFISINGTDISGECVATINGYTARNLRSSLSRNIEPDKIKKYLKSLLSKGNNRFNLTEYKVINQHNLDTALYINYSFELPGYAQTYENELYVKPMLSAFYNNTSFKENEYQYGFNQEYAYFNEEINVFEFPEGYKLAEVPEGKEYHGKRFGYLTKFNHQENKQLGVQHKALLDFKYLEPEFYKEYNDMVKETEKSYNRALVFIKNQ